MFVFDSALWYDCCLLFVTAIHTNLLSIMNHCANAVPVKVYAVHPDRSSVQTFKDKPTWNMYHTYVSWHSSHFAENKHAKIFSKQIQSHKFWNTDDLNYERVMPPARVIHKKCPFALASEKISGELSFKGRNSNSRRSLCNWTYPQTLNNIIQCLWTYPTPLIFSSSLK